MDEDTEVLDWGNEDDEQQAGLHQQRASDGHDAWRDPEDAEDAVSLGGDDDDMQEFYAYQSAEQDSKGQVPPSKSSSSSQLQHSHSSKREHQRQNSTTSQKQTPQSKSSESPALRQSQSFTKLTHALPPKPVVSVAPFVHPLPAQTSTLASSMVQRERRSNGHSVSADGDLLPPDWEMRQPRGSETKDVFYYYNIKTHESTWNRPRMREAPLLALAAKTLSVDPPRLPLRLSPTKTAIIDLAKALILAEKWNLMIGEMIMVASSRRMSSNSRTPCLRSE
ncbi:hypothetical protein A0H81_02678 [Grifola frondosa]|uniref:WW domain-containing protein n=1 Tax=Grifola frondosa TaxID=5627 RepID=A0A1C7MTL2_GRIFR|nr:hypothetical protein A0H81_02678 [Grifola frondosa]